MINFELTEPEVISSYNLARKCDLVYSEILTLSQFKEINPKNVTIIESNDRYIFYKKNEYKLKTNDIIFCNTNLVTELFRDLRKIKNLKNLTLITNQTDDEIDKKLFLKKPRSIFNWFSVNVAYEHNNLIPIPLGLSNDYSPKNLRASEFKSITFSKEFNENKLMYLNFNVNTNTSFRAPLESIYKNEQWSYYEENILNLKDYSKNLKEFKFVLCPQGNGIDTHRIWEALYSGAIPVVQKHISHKNLEGLPILFLDDLRNISPEKLTMYLEKINFEDLNFNKLTCSYWINIMRSKIKEDDSTENIIKANNLSDNWFIFIFKFTGRYKSKLKIFKYYLKKVGRLINLKNEN